MKKMSKNNNIINNSTDNIKQINKNNKKKINKLRTIYFCRNVQITRKIINQSID